MADFFSSAIQAAGSFVDNLFANYRQDKAQDFSADQFATRYQTTVKDMSAAGLNPMLAYSQGGGSSPTSSAASAGSGFSQAGAVYNQGKVATAQTANIEADTENKKAQADLIAAQAAQAWASAGQSNAQVGQINATVDKIREETKNIPIEGKRLYEAAKMLYEQANLMAAQGKSEQFRQGVLQATISKLGAETDLLKYDAQAAAALDNLGRTSKELKPVVDMIRAFMRK